MHKYKINLVTLTDTRKFSEAVSKIDAKVDLIDGKDYKVSAHSMLGAIAALEWNELYCVSDQEISAQILDFIC